MTTYIETKSPDANEMMPLVVRRKVQLAADITQFVLMREDRGELPPFAAGSHLLVVTPNGLSRRYSLCNVSSERYRYVIAVKRDGNGDGGSRSMVDDVVVGTVLSVSSPFNYFPLTDDATRYVLIAGGIGITPIRSMMRELIAKEAEFKLFYCTRSPETTAFRHELASPELAGRVVVHHDHGERDRSLALAPILADLVEGTHLYCCGPRPLMQAVRELTSHWPSSTVHFEDFGTSAHPEQADGEQPFAVRLKSTGNTLEVPPAVSILEVLRRNGVPVPSSCESGTCGTCRTGLLAGEADHRDFVLDDEEQQKEIMICVSRAKSKELLLDL